MVVMPRTPSPSPCASACSSSWSLSSSSSSSSSSFVPSLSCSPSSAKETSDEGGTRTATTRKLRIPQDWNSPSTTPSRELRVPENWNSLVTSPGLLDPEHPNSPVASPTLAVPKYPDSPRVNTKLHVPPDRHSRRPTPGRSSASKTPAPRAAKHKTILFTRQRKQQRDKAPREIPRISPETSPKTPLWQSVRQIMDNETFLRNKCTVLKINLSLARTAHDKLERQVRESRTALADQDARLASLQAELHLERQASQRAAEADAAREQQCQALRAQVHRQAYEVRVYKTALKAAFKLPGVAAQTTYRSILEVTDRHLRMSLGDRLAAVDEPPGTLAPSSTSATSATSATPDGGHAARDSPPGSPADHVLPRKRGPFSLQADAELKTDPGPVVAANEADGRGQAPRPQGAAGGNTDHKPDTPRPPKTNAKRGTESDSDGAPASKTRRLTPRGGARKILHD
ncbi:hypothetical protein E4U43_000566 [Claviceps pusilla]|uniref:Uncharacterized protein n=1 Tax=Claviceps pusilla TaxID=123648 RepID=A0A9P7SXK4_9HYPO|nr:hypothetical protein E4U43_000566 [Claviceps pusilla]